MTDAGNEFDEVYGQMKLHGMRLPLGQVDIQIANAETVLRNCFRYFLSLQSLGFTWLPELKEVAEWLTDNNGRGLFLYGDCGRGKSMLVQYVLPAIILKYTRKIVSVYDVQQMNKQIDEALKKHIIAIDDIGTEEITNQYGNKRLAFAEIMDAAEKYGKLVIISTNLKGEDVIKRYGERVFERIISTTRRIEFKGDSLRV